MQVLIVDDIPANRTLLERALTGWGHEVTEADRGSAAVNRCMSGMPDLILMDVMMPGMSGVEAAALIRKLPGGADTSIIFVTAVREQEGLIPALESGGDDYVTKPVDLSVLAAKIKTHQRIRELSRELAERNLLLERHNQGLRREQALIEHFFDRIEQRNFVPDDMLRYRASSATTFSGDLLLSAARPGGGLYLLIGDFTGHSLTAAMGSLPVAELFDRLCERGYPVGRIARRINRLLETYLPTEIFLAATLLELDATGTLLHYWAGGLPDGVALAADGSVHAIPSQHMPLGILADAEFDDEVRSLRLDRDSRLLLMTDGITEAAAPDGTLFGEARVRQVLGALRPGEDALQGLIGAVADFSHSDGPQDDVVLAELTCRPLPPRAQSPDRRDGADYPTRISISVGAAELADGGVVQRAAGLLCVTPVAAARRAELHTILSELVANAVDHGLLQLHAGERDYTDLSYPERRAQRLRDLADAGLAVDAAIDRDGDAWIADIRVSHTGGPREVCLAADDAEATGGRGLLILDALCDTVQIAPDGRSTRVRYTLS